MSKTLKLSTEEKRIVKAIRELRAQERRLELQAARLRAHGDVSLTEAARLLGRTRTEVIALLGTELVRLESGRLPLSELRRYIERRTKRELSALHAKVAGMFAPVTRKHMLFDSDDTWGRRSLSAAAEALGITEREVNDLVEAGELFAARRGARGARTVSVEEIEAYKAAEEAASSLGAYLWRNLELPEGGPVIRRRAHREAA